MFKFFLAATAALTLAAPLMARAQDVPSYAQQQSADEQIRGRVESFDGGYNLAIRDERGFIDNVQLHDGTIINPTGITLEPGMVVSILGENDGDYLAANEIDTPYNYDDADAGVAYYDGQPWTYYNGPSFGLSFFFGNVGWWHGGDFHGGFHYDRGARVYNNVTIVNHGGYGGRNVGYTNGGRGQVPVYRGEGSVGTTHVPVYRGESPSYTSQPANRAEVPNYRAEPADRAQPSGAGAPMYRMQQPAYRSQPAYRAQPAYHASAPAARAARSNGGGGDHRH